jgi:TolB-like protein
MAAIFAVLVNFAQAQENRALPRLAVVEFSVNDSADRVKRDAITVRNLAESRMVAMGKYQVIAREEIDKLLANQRIQVSDISSKENVRKLQLQNISYIVTGSVDALGNDYVVSIEILDVATGQFSHSDSELVGSGSRDMYNGVTTLVANFVKGLSADGGQAPQAGAQRPGGGVSAAGIGIEVITAIGGTLYLEDKEIAALLDNDVYMIPIEKPETYKIRMVFGNGQESRRNVTVTSQGVVMEAFLGYVGGPGPGGGVIFYDKESYSDGWCYLEAAPASAEFKTDWKDAMRMRLNTGGYRDWFLPGKDVLELMYKNLKTKGLGEFSDDWYWSSSQYDSDRNYAWGQRFSDGYQDGYGKGSTNSVRAVRTF